MSNYLPPRLPVFFFQHHSRAAYLIMDLHYSSNREEVLIQLDNFIKQPRSESMRINLGYYLWKSFNTVNRSESIRIGLGYHLWNLFDTVYILLQEVAAVYQKFLDSTLTLKESARVRNALTVFQCMASHPDARKWLVKEKVQDYLYPFLQITPNVMLPLQLLRLSIFNFIDALTKFDELHGHEILLLFLDTQIFSSCVNCIRDGDKPIKKAATLILMKILMQEEGLRYCCSRPDDFLSVIRILCQLVRSFSYQIPCSQHLKYVVQCFLSLSRVAWEDRVYETVRDMLPLQLIENTFHNIIHKDPEIPEMLHQLVWNLNHRPPQ
ncbi:hypothetical protein MTR67_024110 [Solanum verrucosum]|uniref:Uncharacterized protein n=1 Tax=Solanum verrucosum TaxID=315347 RepID=A0AAF0QXT2_SOLVR|nr:uncharacterized protein LOC125831544 [Solanum verrucosum]WMV30725.1 hypothetical protein MTR67_024110 [Solanum verrucosum]